MKKKIATFILLVFSICLIASNVSVYAVDISSLKDREWTNPQQDQVKTIGGAAIAIMQVIGTSIALIMLISIAIKYMASAPNERAEIKKHMMPYILGAVFIFAAVGIVSMIRSFILK